MVPLPGDQQQQQLLFKRRTAAGLAEFTPSAARRVADPAAGQLPP
jgi:hypothetical protein